MKQFFIVWVHYWGILADLGWPTLKNMESDAADIGNSNSSLGLVDRVEEGRIALYQLEKHLKDSQRADPVGDSGSVSSNRQVSLKSERSILDQTARDTRLHYRKDSPLGLTVEELDDRGLLDGGSVPSYYTSIRQRTRRPLEMKKRSSRMQDRNGTSKMLKNVYHMIRTLVKRGLRMEEYCRQYDTGNCGMIDKKRFTTMIRNIGLPLTPKEITELTSRYSVPSTDMVDFEALLRDANVAMINKTSVTDGDFVGQDSVESLRGAEVGAYTGVLLDTKRMLIESVQSLGKSLGDVYRMFARWDNEGTGTVTAAQFLRVLTKLHIDLSDQDQDFVVELLDTNAQGRIDFESLLSFCFAETVPELGSPNGMGIRAIFLEEETEKSAGGNETVLSAVSYDGLHEQKSTGSTGLDQQATLGNIESKGVLGRRPHTAGKVRKSEYEGGNDGSGGGSADDHEFDRTSSPGKGQNQRPVTALARVSSQDPNDKQRKGSGGSNSRAGADRNPNLAMELPDFIVNDYDEDDYVGSLTPISNMPGNLDNGDVGSLNDNTLVTEHHEEYNIGSPLQGVPSGANGNNGGSLDGLTVSLDSRDGGGMAMPDSGLPPRHNANRNTGGGGGQGRPALARHNNDSLESLISAPSEHVAMLVDQTLSTLREMIISRHRTGKTLQEIFQHFDRDGKGYFDVTDFIRGASDLRIETTEKVARPSVGSMAIDGIDKVSLGEFVVFVTDPDHKTLEQNIRSQVAQLLEQAGSEEGFRNRLFEVFWEEDSRKVSNQHNRLPGVVSTSAFISALGALNLHLSISEVDRLIARFDISGSGACSVERFVNMVSSGESWERARSNSEAVQRAKWEAQQLRQEIRSSSSRRTALHNAGITEEVISTAEYLGICVLSEQNLLWIAADAFKAPLPVSWSSQKDSKGRTFFYNHLTNESSWDHPLDPHFRQLIDGYRQGNVTGMNTIAVAQAPINMVKSPPPKSTDPRFTQIPSNLHPPNSERPRSALPTSGVDKNASWKEQQQQQAQALINANYSQRQQGVTREERASLLFGVATGSNRPSSAPNHIRKGASAGAREYSQYNETRTKAEKARTEKAYSQQYFNLSHYKQNGYKVEEVERLHREAREMAQGMGAPSSSGGATGGQGSSARRRPQSSGAARRPRSGSASGRPRLTSAGGNRGASHSASNPNAPRQPPAYNDFTTYHQNAGENNNQLSGVGSRPAAVRQSVVDRALFGEPVPTWLQPKEKSNWQGPSSDKYDVSAMAAIHSVSNGLSQNPQGQLAELYDEDLIGKLDSRMNNNR